MLVSLPVGFIWCFNIGDIANLAVSVFGNEDYIYPEFISYLREFGLWDDQSNFLISDLFETIILNNYLIKNNQDPPILNSDLNQLKRINVINTWKSSTIRNNWETNNSWFGKYD